MLKNRIIPIVLLDGFSVLKTVRFNERRNLGSPVTVMRTYNTRNVDEMILLDIDASKQCRPIDKFTIKEISADCFMPLTVGGGISNCKHIEELLSIGADKISINTAPYKNPILIQEAAANFGSQCIVVSVDIVKVDQTYHLYSNNKVLEGLDVIDWIAKIQELGAGEILINDVSKDGTMSGFDTHLAEMVAGMVEIPLIYAGGINSPSNACDLIKASGADAAGVSSIFHFTDYTPEDCRKSLRSAGVPARRGS